MTNDYLESNGILEDKGTVLKIVQSNLSGRSKGTHLLIQTVLDSPNKQGGLREINVPIRGRVVFTDGGVTPLTFGLYGYKNLSKKLLSEDRIVNPVIRQGRHRLLVVCPQHPIDATKQSKLSHYVSFK